MGGGGGGIQVCWFCFGAYVSALCVHYWLDVSSGVRWDESRWAATVLMDFVFQPVVEDVQLGPEGGKFYV